MKLDFHNTVNPSIIISWFLVSDGNVKQTREEVTERNANNETIWKLGKIIVHESSGKKTKFTAFDFCMIMSKMQATRTKYIMKIFTR